MDKEPSSAPQASSPRRTLWQVILVVALLAGGFWLIASWQERSAERPTQMPHWVQPGAAYHANLYDKSGTEVCMVADGAFVEELARQFAAAPMCQSGWLFDPNEIVAKLGFSSGTSVIRKYVLLRTDCIIELGPAPDEACRQIDVKALLTAILEHCGIDPATSALIADSEATRPGTP